jgi:YVTN family beta-propeller protein
VSYLAFFLLVVPLAASTVRIIQTNSGGDDVSIIDPVTNKVVGTITGIEVNHGVAAAPGGSYYYVSDEGRSTLDVVDTKTLKVIRRIPLTGHPNNISISKDGRRVYVGIAVAPGAVDVIDTASLEKVKSIPVKGSVHNTYVTPDGKYVVSGSIPSKTITVIDQSTEEPVWSLQMDLGIRPMAFRANPDGSTKWIFVQLSGFNGFAVVDFATHKEINRIKLPELPPGKAPFREGGNESHGMAVTSDGKTLVVNSRLNTAIYVYSLPDLNVMGSTEVGRAPDWVTLTPDGKTAYVANAASNSVSVVDIPSMKELTRIPVGEVPKRNITAILPASWTPSHPYPSATAAVTLDYETYKRVVEPIFFTERAGHARCVACHATVNSAFRLQPLSEGRAWTDEQSHMNFECVKRLVNSSNPEKSRLLLHPLAHEAGGDEFHSGGRQFLSKSDPDWKAMASWAGVNEAQP